jgi:phosphatidate cytidylyltransferase
VSVEAGLAPSPGRQNLRKRFVTAVVLGPLFLVAAAVGGLVFLGAIMLLVGVAAWEFFRMASRKSARPRTAPGIGLALAFPAVFYWAPNDPLAIPVIVALGVIGIAVAHLLDADGDESIGSVSTTVYGAAYVGLLLAHFILIREVSRGIPGMPYWSGAVLVAMTVVLTWVNDSAAYAIGHRWGRRKLIPRISPGKTVEGAAGALLVTVLSAVPLLWLVDRWVPLFGLADALAIGSLVGIAAPLGDLVESAFKRDAGVKDASDLVPGHGGVLDRFDSLIVVAPAFWYYLRAVVL